MNYMSPQRASSEPYDQPAPLESIERRYRVGKWELLHTTKNPRTIYAIPHLSRPRQLSLGLYYGEGVTPPMAWDCIIPPAYVRTAALNIIRGLNNNTPTEGIEQ